MEDPKVLRRRAATARRLGEQMTTSQNRASLLEIARRLTEEADAADRALGRPPPKDA